jgi:hypothetical protein
MVSIGATGMAQNLERHVIGGEHLGPTPAHAPPFNIERIWPL